MHVLLYLTKANISKFHCKLRQAARLENAIICALINFCKQIYFENLTQNLCHKKVWLFFEIAKVYKNHASKKANILKVVDLILFLYRGIWSSLFLNLPAFWNFAHPPAIQFVNSPIYWVKSPMGVAALMFSTPVGKHYLH